MNIYFIIILSVIILGYVFDTLIELLNLNHLTETLPKEFEDTYDQETYLKSQRYLKDQTRFSLIKDTISVCVIILFIVYGGFNSIDIWVRQFNQNSIITGLYFFGVLGLLSQIMSIPFSIYNTFILEKKYAFNTTTIKTYLLDLVKANMLLIVIGGPLSAAILWFFEETSLAWMWCWLFMVVVQIVFIYLAPILIMPLFNKFSPLEDAELKQTILDYTQSQEFALKGIFTMDGSKRSKKSNAFFTGLGQSRRIVLFDTLIENHTTQELLGVVAHEMGHYKKKHITKHMIVSVVTLGMTLFIFSIFMNNPLLFEAFKMTNLSIYSSFVFFGLLYAPIEMILGIFSNVMSRKHEYEADAYAVNTTKDPESMIQALKKLSKDNLSNLTPHPLKVFLEYSHPPVMSRINAIRRT
ncbi:MAG: M48 family metallopeptidase [Candidatus Margulisbacteria bacterium]|nr:M48 family metallopeptidase [Candidatus Margulisiibacteriota bacterium]